MGFSDSDYELLAMNGISKTQIYKMAGNSIVVTVLEHLFKQIYNVFKMLCGRVCKRLAVKPLLERLTILRGC